MITMYPPQNNSPQTSLAEALGSGATTISVADATVLPAAPNVLTIGTTENAELVLCTNITENILTIERAFNGTTAQAWDAGTPIYRAITAQDVSALQDNLTDHVDATDIHVTPEEKEKWNTPPAAPVQSVFGRTGAVVSQSGDYTAEQVGAAKKSEVVSATLLAADWTGDGVPYSLTLSVDGITAISAQELLPVVSPTLEELTALQAANIQDGGQQDGAVTLLAYGTKPSIDLPIRIVKRGDVYA